MDEKDAVVRIVFDCFKLVKGSGKSIGIYNQALNMIRHMADHKKESSDEKIRKAELIVIGNPINRADFEISGLTFVCITELDPLNRLHALWWELAGVSGEIKKLHADRVIFPRGFCALTHPVKDTVIIHDMIPFYYHEHYPGYFNKIENAYIMRRLVQSARKARRVVTVSEASKKDIVKYAKIDERKITVLYNGCEKPGREGFADRKGGKPYLAAVTSLLPHKNAEGIIKAYTEYFRSAETPLDLVVTGIDNVDAYDVPSEIREHITCHKYIESDSELYGIIGRAEIFLFLSLAEGFGFPPVEAMQLGVPVICSDRTSLPEIVGDAAILADPCDHSEVGKQLLLLAGDEELRHRLVEKGYENIRRFSWDDLAGKYWEEYLR